MSSSQGFVTAILLTSGQGRRFEKKIPKQFHLLSGKKIYLYALETLCSSSMIDAIVIAAEKQWHDIIKKEISFCSKPIHLVEGGDTRQLSCYRALLECDPKTTHVVVHDSVRPFLTEKILHDNVVAARNYGACDTCISSFDTIVHTIDFQKIANIPQRANYLRGQTPQSFSYALLLRAHELAMKKGISEASDDCQLVLELSHPIFIVQGSQENIKITTEQDLLLAEQLLRLTTVKNISSPEESLKGKIFALAGASGGLGQAIASALKKEQGTVLELSRTSSHQVDLTNPHETRKIFKKIFEIYGKIDGLINAAGFLIKKPFQDLEERELFEMIHTNFTATALACKYCKIKQGGHIINLSSSSYTRGRSDYIIYSSMKAAVVNFTQGLAQEHPDLHIHALIPSRTNTPMRRKNFPDESSEWLLNPEDVAKKAVELLRTKKITGMMVEINKD